MAESKAKNNDPATKPSRRELVITRAFDGPRELVMSEMAEAGWNESIDKLAKSLGKEKSI